MYLRAERFRILFTAFPDERVVVFTTAFLEKHKEDDHQAVSRHDARVRAWEYAPRPSQRPRGARPSPPVNRCQGLM
jgi:hypothetical protein